MKSTSSPCVFFSVGEPSGDVHGANLIRELQQQCPSIRCVGLGGPKMQSAGCELQFELTTLAVMGLLRVLPLLYQFWKVYRSVGNYFDTHQVDAVILIDFPGFNWWVAKAAKARGISVYYYGAPQMWAWASWRIRKIKRLVDVALCKLPFEAKWYQERGMRAIYVGHPFYDEIAQQKVDAPFVKEQTQQTPLVLLLPGSRDQEVDRNLPSLIQAATDIHAESPTTRLAISCLHPRHAKQCRDILGEMQIEWIDVYAQRTADLMRAATACIACSGSVSLELMYNEVPTVIVYRLNRWTMLLNRMLVRVRYITLVNLLWTDRIEKESTCVFDPDAPGSEQVPFPEYVTIENPGDRVAAQILSWLQNPQTLLARRQQLIELKSKVAQLGASRRGAELILELLSDRLPQSAESPVSSAA